MEGEDPWFWDNERVVQELCTSRRSWPDKSPNQRMPDPEKFAKALREHEIDGSTLLTEIDVSGLREDLGVVAIAQRGTVKWAIRQLQDMSPKYQEYIARYVGSERSDLTGTMADLVRRQSRLRTGSEVLFTNVLPYPRPEPVPSQGQGPDSRAVDPPHEQTWVANELGSKRRRLGLDSPEEDMEIHYDKDVSMQANILESVETDSSKKDGLSEFLKFDDSHEIVSREVSSGEAAAFGKKQKRIAPTLITSSTDINRDRSIPTQADSVRFLDPQSIEPGVVYKGDDGKKRLIPMLQTKDDVDGMIPQHPDAQGTEFLASKVWGAGPRGAKDLPQGASQRRSDVNDQQSLCGGYLGKKKIPVDIVFYDLPVGKELPAVVENQEIAQLLWPISSGRRLYVNGVMKQYFRSKRQVVRRDGKVFSAIRPYSKRLAPMHHTPSFTLFHRTEDGSVHAAREELSKWPEVDPETASMTIDRVDDLNERHAQFDLPDNLQLGGPSSYNDWDPSMLDKYRYIDGGDTILPLFGDSDAEDAIYDDDTMREIEEEHGLSKSVLRGSKKPGLSDDDINKAIDDGIAEIIARWKLKKLPKRQRKAWKLWHKARKDKDKRGQVRDAQQQLDRINNERIPKMRRSIVDEHWGSHKQVRRQTRIMEQTIYDREDLSWRISTLERRIPPENIQILSAKPIKPRKSIQLAYDQPGEDGEPIDSESSFESSDDGLDDFIVNDETDLSAAERQHGSATDDGDGHLNTSDMELSDGNTLSVSENTRTESSGIIGDDTSRITHDNDDQFETIAQFEEAEGEKLSSINEGDRVSARDTVDHPPMPSQQAADKRIKSESTAARTVEVSAMTTPGHSLPEVVDLTGLPETSAGEEPPISSRIKRLESPETPFKDPFQDSYKPRIKLIVKHSLSSEPDLPISNTDVTKNVIQISDSDEVVEMPKVIPPITDFQAMAEFSTEIWIKRGDRARLLITVLMQMKQDARAALLELFTNLSEHQIWSGMIEVMCAMRDGHDKVRGVDANTFRSQTGVIRLFKIYTDCRDCAPRVRLPAAIVGKLRSKRDMFQPFHQLSLQVLTSGCNGNICKLSINPKSNVTDFGGVGLPAEDVTTANDEDVIAAISAPRRRSRHTSGSEEEEEEHRMPHKIRKRKVFENAQARDLREQDQQRLAEQDHRRKILRQKLAQSDGELDVEKDRIIINDAKLEYQGFIYVHDQIARRIKKHQVNGVRFMWNQVITNDKTSQGCLLAHTMGLGKTMQIITLLTAISEAASSSDPTVSSQIPEALRVPRTLVLCPPGLIDNWMDELLTWAPVGVLGDLRKVDASVKDIQQRLKIISDFYHGGGVLVLGYEMFRLLVENKLTRTRMPPLGDAEHKQALKHLLDGPNIIVADEAHKMKNARSSLTIAANQFRSRTRIALTGSPLANNVEEYHTMIEWVAPNYLGPIVEFRSKYVEPIQQGLYSDSTPYERRKSLKMLGVLKEDLSPKVHRADMSVLRHDLKPKTEFVITVPLTDLQAKAYTIYVRSMLGKSSRSGSEDRGGKLLQTTIWHWLAVLSLLCNHPECFLLKLQERKDDAGKMIDSREVTSDEDVYDDESNVPIWKVGVSDDLVRQEVKLFNSFGQTLGAVGSGMGAIEDVENSNKVSILNQILDEARAVGDKVLIFSQSIPTLDYLERLCVRTGRSYSRLDGKTNMSKRQLLTKQFNTGDKELYLISTTAGGLGLNLPGANRVIIFDFKYNPIMEEQAIGRAYRIGQQKPVYVYRFVAGGTFEDGMHNKAVFKTQLASRVVDKKNPIAWAKKKVGEFLFEPKPVEQQDLSSLRGRDPLVLDKILDRQIEKPTIRAIVMTDTFERHDDDVLTAEEQNEVKQLLSDEQLKRSDPEAWKELLQRRDKEAYEKRMAIAISQMEFSELHSSGLLLNPQQLLKSSQLSSPYPSSIAATRTPLLGRPRKYPLGTPSASGQSFQSPTAQITEVPKMGFVPQPSQSRSGLPDLTPIRGTNTQIRASPSPPTESALHSSTAASWSNPLGLQTYTLSTKVPSPHP
ncbi:MAG: hypothetical protein M1818_000342 [Claussenomyces sp. TS43310]|nr:MAG: hypothetical protein M1818_000342 [Claussenomyces sp. TS43310]